ncbi:B12-binding domain-containing radical SAM protein [Nocardia vermiculata]|uniref:Radical SAM protein n=1 Tax=Nocardia vermiculata TaxID=257274 RepID=A0A846Y2F9_9NOCA|nr:cobalamin-dependent protein [Nocardia vermiculata]NKY52182.1 radical SAM protein [Nocardia vermiculata]
MHPNREMQVLVVSPPNSNTVLDGATCTVTKPEEHTDWSDFPNLGILTLASAIRDVPGVRPVYLDATVMPWDEVLAYLEEHAAQVLALCISALTATYEAGLDLCAAAKRIDSRIITIVGNDHMTALSHECMSRRAGVIDYGFVGNEVIGSFTALISALRRGESVRPERYPGLATRADGRVAIQPQATEPIFTALDYSLLDAAFDHTSRYDLNFRKRVVPTFARLTGRQVRAGMPVEIGRGCIKFARNDACSFCSIQFGGMWRNAVPDAAAAWHLLHTAYSENYDYLYLTADELPLTFGRLLREMLDSPPRWWRDLADDERPVLVGYARADGLSDERHTTMLRSLGVRQLMVGLDAGTAASLHAMNKPLTPVRDRDSAFRAEKMFDHNVRALRAAGNAGLLLKVGFVVGHLGMNEHLLQENVDSMKALLDSGAGAIASLDVEVLSPEPGSADFTMLLDPARARTRGEELGLPLPEMRLHERHARKWRGMDVIDREQAMADYVESVMPGLTLNDLAQARNEVRKYGESIGLTIGG